MWYDKGINEKGKTVWTMRERLKSVIDFILPKYAYVPIVAAVGTNMLVYFATKPFVSQAEHYDLSIFIDDRLPFVPFFILFYVLAYLQWAWHYIYHYRKSREDCYHYATADVIAKLLCLVFFLALPAEIERPTLTGDGFWEYLTGLIYAADSPHNLFPSIHCLASWLCFRSALEIKTAPRWYAPAQLVFSLLVFASTVLVKQHFFVDIFAGIAVVEIAWFLSRRLRLWRVFEKIELPFVRRADTNLKKDG
ncbi:MAG: phosphatase PAP2 family protein [Clostridia bacterium]|nr:phosphatase PAP2 family protein [Clostridia bacterium]